MFDGYFMEIPFSTCTNKFALTIDKVELHCGLAMNRHLFKICNIRISYSDKEILLFDEENSGSFLHTKLQPQVASSHE